jgi:hypothetical protein
MTSNEKFAINSPIFLVREKVIWWSLLSVRLRRIGVETRLKGYKYFEIERDFFNKLGVLVDGDFNLVYCYLFLFVSLVVSTPN